MNKLPIVTIQLEHMRDNIQHAMMAHGDEVNAAVAIGVQNAIDGFDIQGAAERHTKTAVEAAIQTQISNYFDYGEGHKIIKDVINEALS